MQRNKPTFDTLPSGRAAQRGHERRSGKPPALFLFWRWLTCGHGRHRWQLQAGIDLARHGNCTHVFAVRSCPRCGLVEVLE